MKRLSAQIVVDNKFLILLILVLAVNTAMVGLGYNFLSKYMVLQEEEFNYKQGFARDLWDYNRRLANDLGVEDRSSVRDALSRLIQEVELASTGDELAQAILSHGRRVQETILREYENRQRERILALVNRDMNFQDLQEDQVVVVNASLESGIVVDPADVFLEETIQDIADIVFESETVLNFSIAMEVEDGRARLVHSASPVEQIRNLNEEMDSLRVALRETRSSAGYLDMTGEGIVVKIYDAADGYTTDAIIHETDVRDVVNELYASGAKGVAVGGQRLIVTSAIRCVGPVILVNDERIPVNPVVIQAVGDPRVLESGISIIRLSLESMRDLRFEVEPADSLTLPAYSR